MPKVTVGLSKKIGLPDYGSVGASCQIEYELDGTVLQKDLEAIQQNVRRAYAACAQAVNDELARQQTTKPPNAAPAQPEKPAGAPAVNQSSNGRSATDKQLDYAERLSGQIKGLGVRRLETLAKKMFGKLPGQLTSLEASGLIDTLKEIKAGSIELEAALNGAAR